MPFGILTSPQIDRWEHACLLYHGGDWVSATLEFSGLASRIQSSAERQLCMLNQSILLARLGALCQAREVAQEAVALDAQSACSCYILGLVQAELGNAHEADFCFDICVQLLTDPGYNTNQWRLGFTPLISDLKHNSNMCKAAVKTASRIRQRHEAVSGLYRLPTDHLFLPPSRSQLLMVSPVEQTTRRPSVHGIGLVPAKTKKFMTRGRANTDTIPPHALVPLQQKESAQGPSHCTVSGGVLSTISSNQPLRSMRSAPAISNHVRTPIVKIMPRDARVQPVSVRALASFIRHTGPRDQPISAPERSHVTRVEHEHENAMYEVLHLPYRHQGIAATDHEPRQEAHPDKVYSYHALLTLHPALNGNIAPEVLPSQRLRTSTALVYAKTQLPLEPRRILQHAIARRARGGHKKLGEVPVGAEAEDRPAGGEGTLEMRPWDGKEIKDDQGGNLPAIRRTMSSGEIFRLGYKVW